MMDISYVHTQKRRYFGTKCSFCSVGPYLCVDIDPNPELKKQFVEVTNIEKETMCLKDMALHKANTDLKETVSCGMNHQVGGWPVDVDPRAEDQVARYKKKIHKDENFINSVKQLSFEMENFVMENNSVDIYEEYFEEESFDGKEESQFKTLSVYRDNCDVKRKVVNLSWALDSRKIAAAYSCNQAIKSFNGSHFHSYVWDIENCNVPYCILMPETSLNCVEYSPRDLELLIGGYGNGQLVLWDGRMGGPPQQQTPIAESHKEEVSGIKWISSKTGLEFFSSSVDGKLLYWDARNLTTPTQTFDPNMNSEEKLYSITCLEYDTTSPHRFMLGTEQGMMLSCNRKFKDPSEVISSYYYTHTGPVMTIERNTFFPKLFASCSTWDVKVWSEDLTESPMMNLVSQDGYVTDVAWSKTHASFLLITKTTGHLELWDILIKNQDPILLFKLESDGLVCIDPKQIDDQAACGTANGCIHLMEMPKYETFSSKQEKNQVAAMIDRESKREKLLEGMTREQRVREKNSKHLKSVQTFPPPEDTHMFNEDESDKNNHAKEFDSCFESDENLQDEEVDENEFEKPFFDLQFTNILQSVVKD